ncbi:MAG: hypothetical protein JWN57_1149 [Frankiales bacterium]|nr:hypothetical protein [Frankiales bacterium]
MADAERRSELHEVDPVSLVLGLVLLLVGGGYLLRDALGLGFDVTAVGAVVLVLLGAAGLLLTLRRGPA